MNDLKYLLKKYNKPVPRYTSYPAVPFWNSNSFNEIEFLNRITSVFKEENSTLSIYIHLPYCEELCTYCACNKRITKNHAVEEPYIEALLKEWEMYKLQFSENIKIAEIHLGGGTPTFFSPQNLKKLVDGITNNCTITQQHEFSVEIHPNFTSEQHLIALRDCGFNRISIGIQDFDEEVQFLINRKQTFEQTASIFDLCRKHGFKSINADLVYGLPHQNTNKIENTIHKLLLLKPDRIAFYSYAHVPWKSKAQRRYTDEDVPGAEEKINMYLLGKQLLNNAGYVSIGMDHFSKPDDMLCAAQEAGKLHRNFMGYTTNNHKILIGLGASSISDAWTAFSQNEKTVEDYMNKINRKQFAFTSGHLLNDDDMIRRKSILELMCNFNWTGEIYNLSNNELEEFLSDGLIQKNKEKYTITETGKLFIRNIASTQDKYFRNLNSDNKVFSKSV